jgi:acyl phosphate:glycerol-3-phosphate acyltransferase
MTIDTNVLLALLVGYLFGSVPFGVIVTRIAGAGDLRSIGSGNIGATNVLRTGRKGLAAMTLLGDMLKGTAAVILVSQLVLPDTALAAGLAAFFGHLFPVWLRFKGGKGVATYLGVILGLHWPLALIFAALWLATAYLTRYSSLSALIASVLTPVFAFYLGGTDIAVVLFFMTAVLWWMHRANIARLMAGTEGRIGSKNERPTGGSPSNGSPAA